MIEAAQLVENNCNRQVSQRAGIRIIYMEKLALIITAVIIAKFIKHLLWSRHSTLHGLFFLILKNNFEIHKMCYA